ncbi:hypothetical protein GCM10010985_27670 [Caballeronia grimmiae]|uniref:Uncharacterized protein n=1 Tax=Caballeronia grimmiae TaxID=1071679 RepID=A0ABQ1RMI7_9BURK|nr:hypothetical protein GCM10010985_27670 [Caballeronia grimmiae]
MTGIPLMPAKTIVPAASRTDISGLAEIIDFVMMSDACMSGSIETERTSNRKEIDSYVIRIRCAKHESFAYDSTQDRESTLQASSSTSHVRDCEPSAAKESFP